MRQRWQAARQRHAECGPRHCSKADEGHGGSPPSRQLVAVRDGAGQPTFARANTSAISDFRCSHQARPALRRRPHSPRPSVDSRWRPRLKNVRHTRAFARRKADDHHVGAEHPAARRVCGRAVAPFPAAANAASHADVRKAGVQGARSSALHGGNDTQPRRRARPPDNPDPVRAATASSQRRHAQRRATTIQSPTDDDPGSSDRLLAAQRLGAQLRRQEGRP